MVLGSKFQITLFSCLFVTLSTVFLLELNMYQTKTAYELQLAALKQDNAGKLAANAQVGLTINDKVQEIQQLTGAKAELAAQISDLNARIAGLTTDNSSPFPFAVPTTGTIGSQVSTYLDNYKGILHYGIDIWTNKDNGGAVSTHKGNPVYAACSGRVESFQPDNGGVTISCDPITPVYNVPALKVYTYYGHMANSVTREQYTTLKQGERVRKGQFIGFQGDLSMFTPEMRNVHLHFSIFTGYKEASGTQDPCKYIGGVCTEAGRFLVNQVR